jgi:hydroxyquinol 1,2-dioxygenase
LHSAPGKEGIVVNIDEWTITKAVLDAQRGCTDPRLKTIANGAHGEPCFVNGTVKGNEGEPIADAHIAVWHSDEDGFYDVQRPELSHLQARGNLRSLADGRFYFKSIVAAPYPIPNDGPVGRMLSAAGRHPWRPAHLHFMITAPGYEPLITHIFRDKGPYLDSDAVFGVRSSLIAAWERRDAGSALADGTPSSTPFYTLRYDFKLFRLARAQTT